MQVLRKHHLGDKLKELGLQATKFGFTQKLCIEKILIRTAFS
jgi:hypothetical protein